MTDPDERHRALLRALVGHQVRFVLVGGVALQLRGFSGATRDVDVTIAADALNQRRLASALEALRARPYLAGDRGTAYHTHFGQLEVMHRTDGVGGYDAWARHASTVEIEPGLIVQVGSASDLLLAKEQAGRAKDIEALPRIRAELIANGRSTRRAYAARSPNSPASSHPIRGWRSCLGRARAVAANAACGITPRRS